MQTTDSDELLQRLASTAERLSYNASWNPAYSGDSKMRISRDGRWYYQGSLIARPALVQLFSRLLRREDEQYYLVTPVEKLSIAVDDAPFVSTNIKVQGQGDQQNIYVTTNLGDTVLLGSEHPLWVNIDPQTQEPSPYSSIGNGLPVLIQRSDFYRLVDLAEQTVIDQRTVLGVWSQQQFFVLGELWSRSTFIRLVKKL